MAGVSSGALLLAQLHAQSLPLGSPELCEAHFDVGVSFLDA